MEIRFLEPKDSEQIKYIYDTYFNDMEYSDFYSGFHCVYVVHKNDKIIAVGGLRPINEAVVITDGDESVRKRKDALMQIHNALTYSAEKMKCKRIFAFTFDKTYSNHLIKRIGFSQIKESKLLVLEL